MTLTTTTEHYPNGQPYISICIDGKRIGHVEAVDGGYRDFHMRKSRPTINRVAVDILRRDLKRLHREVAEVQGWLTALEREP